MVSFRESSVEEPGAHALLAEYFGARELGFTGNQPYRIAFPKPADFEPPQGVFLVVTEEELVVESGELVVEPVGADVGCGGIRRVEPGVEPGDTGGIRYEVKHLWLQPRVRGRGLSRQLLGELERRAIAFGATELVLDTNASLEAAAGLYRSSGFVGIEPYNDNPNATNWYRKTL
jgi:ribosomal protein S18 acetylase RimI-like enzyme